LICSRWLYQIRPLKTFVALQRANLMRSVLVLLNLLLSACSTVDAPPAAYVLPSPPSLTALREGVKKASTDEKLTGPLEMSALRKADRGFGKYFVCMREANSSTERRPAYSVFFDNDDYKGVRRSVIIEDCEAQVFSPAELGGSSVSLADGQPPGPGHRKQTYPSN
jgi:hypothetical protein